MKNDSLSRERLQDQPLSCADQICQVQWSDLPLACPLPGSSLWNGHPRIYLPIHQDGSAMCTYCGTLYTLQRPTPGEPEPHFANLEIERCYRQALQHAQTDSTPQKLSAPQHDPT